MSLQGALYQRLAGDSELAALLPVHRGAPAIFTARPVPADAPLPLLLIGSVTAEWPLDVQGVRLSRLELALSVFARQEVPFETLAAPLRRARALLEAAPLVWTGGRLELPSCRGPLAVPAERPWRAVRLACEGLYFPETEGDETP